LPFFAAIDFWYEERTKKTVLRGPDVAKSEKSVKPILNGYVMSCTATVISGTQSDRKRQIQGARFNAFCVVVQL
jgi:hypothetical protein